MTVVGPEEAADGLVDRHSWPRERCVQGDRGGKGTGLPLQETGMRGWLSRPRTRHGSALKVVFPTEAPSEGLVEGEEWKEVSLGQSSAKSFHQGGGKHSGTFFSCGNEFLTPPVYLSSCAHCYLVRMSLLNRKKGKEAGFGQLAL